MGRSRRRPSRHSSDGQPEPGSTSQSAGSPEPEYLIVGEIIRPHGVRGDVAMKSLTAYPERLGDIETLYVGEDFTPYQVKRIRPHQAGMIILFQGLSDRDQAEELRGEMVRIHMDDAVPLEDGEYYLFQIEGIRVVTDEGQELGHLTDYIETGANDVYIITTPEGSEVLIPAIPDVIRQVDLEAHVMTIRLLDGLI
jgi:16S rRNA processing protein RimM